MLVDAAAAAGVVLMPGHTFEHNAAVHKLRDLVRGGHLGRLFYLDCARLNLGLYQADVNVIFDLAPHDISISNFVLGSRPTTVTVWASRPRPSGTRRRRLHTARLRRPRRTVEYPRQLAGSAQSAPDNGGGIRKMVVYDDMADEERIRVYDKSATPPEDSDAPLSGIAYHLGEMVSPFVPFAEPWRSGSALRRLHRQRLVPLRGREQRPGRRPDPGMRPDLTTGAAPGGAGRGDTTADRLARRARQAFARTSVD